MKKIFKLVWVITVLLTCGLVCGCATNSGANEVASDSLGTTPTPETEAPETEAPVVLSPEMQEKLGGLIPKNWQTGIDAILESVPSDFMFAVQTDTHFSVVSGGSSGNSVKALSHFIPLSFCANIGDYIKGYFKGEAGKADNTPELTMQSLKELTSRYLDEANCPMLITFGNHDTNQLWCQNYGVATQQLTQADHYREVISKLKEHNGSAMVNDGESNYYYMDFHADKVRVIMLNTTDGSYESEYDSVYVISDRQAEWFEKTALDTDYSVIVMAHIPFYSEFSNNDKAPKNADKVLGAVESFIKNGGKFVAYMYGHTHAQSDMVDENGRLHISFKNGGGNAEVVAVNLKARKIYTFGLGDAADRDFEY